MKKITNDSTYKARIVDELVKRDLRIFGAICIEGPKWCGKTWTSSHHAIIPKCHICHGSHASLVYMLKNIGLEGAHASIEGAFY